MMTNNRVRVVTWNANCISPEKDITESQCLSLIRYRSSTSSSTNISTQSFKISNRDSEIRHEKEINNDDDNNIGDDDDEEEDNNGGDIPDIICFG